MKRHIYSYAQLDAVAQRHYDGETNCCSVIATAAAARVSFGKALATQMNLGKRRNRGVPWPTIHAALKRLGCVTERLDYGIALDLFGKTLVSAKRHAKAGHLGQNRGTFLIHTRSHITCIRDGEMVDWADDRNSRKRIIWVERVIINDAKSVLEIQGAKDHRVSSRQRVFPVVEERSQCQGVPFDPPITGYDD